MRKIKILFLIVLSVMSFASFAQISTRSDDPSTFRFGTRPQAGTMGFSYYMGFTSGKFNLKKEPIINIQYYLSEDLAIRAGLKFQGDRNIASGTISDTMINAANLTPGIATANKVEYKQTSREHSIYIGIEKHFMKTNFLDPYVAVQIPLGIVGETNIMNIDERSGNYDHSTAKRNSLMYGLDGYLGLQAFVADLPIAVGFEWGFMSRGYMMDKTHNVVETKTGTVTTTHDYYTPHLDSTDPLYTTSVSGINYSKLNSRQFSVDNAWRIKVCYYFTK